MPKRRVIDSCEVNDGAYCREQNDLGVHQGTEEEPVTM